MEQVFDQCQQFEEKRLSFLREVLLDVKCHLNLTEDQRFDMFGSADVKKTRNHCSCAKSLLPAYSYTTVYGELEHTITSASAVEDLKWFSNNHGPGMHMNWPQFEVQEYSLMARYAELINVTNQTEHICSHVWQEYNPDLTHSITKKSKKGNDGVMLTNITAAAADRTQAGERGR